MFSQSYRYWFMLSMSLFKLVMTIAKFTCYSASRCFFHFISSHRIASIFFSSQKFSGRKRKKKWITKFLVTWPMIFYCYNRKLNQESEYAWLDLKRLTFIQICSKKMWMKLFETDKIVCWYISYMRWNELRLTSSMSNTLLDIKELNWGFMWNWIDFVMGQWCDVNTLA